MPGKACQHCDADDCNVHCAGAADGKHQPDVESGRYSTRTARAVVFDFTCRGCGLTGGLEVPFEAGNVQWD